MAVDIPNKSRDAVPALKKFCIYMIQFISSRTTDPHLYFEAKFSSEVSRTESLDDLLLLLENLVATISSIGIDAKQLMGLDETMSSADLPSFSLMRSSGQTKLGLVMAVGIILSEQDRLLVEKGIEESKAGRSVMTNSDERLLARLLDDYRNRRDYS